MPAVELPSGSSEPEVPVPDPVVVRALVEGLCDEAWHGRMDLNAAGLNPRPQAEVIAPAVLRALHEQGYMVVRRSA